MPNSKDEERQKSKFMLLKSIGTGNEMEALWSCIIAYEGYPFWTAKQLEYSYRIQGYELFVEFGLLN